MPKLLTETMTFGDFEKMAEKNGWEIKTTDCDFIEDLWNLTEKHSKDPMGEKLNELLMLIYEKEIWYWPVRKLYITTLIDTLENYVTSDELENNGGDQIPNQGLMREEINDIIENKPRVPKKQGWLDNHYKKILKKERPLTEEEQSIIKAEEEKEKEAERKRREKELEEEERIEYEYRLRVFESNVPENQKKFDDYFKIGYADFCRKAGELGWRHYRRLKPADKNVVGKIYELARDTMDPRLMDICRKIYDTPIDTIEKRSAFLSEIKSTLEAIYDEDILLGDRRIDLYKIINNNLVVNIDEKDLEKDNARYREQLKKEEEIRQQKEKELKDREYFKEILHSNGWDPKSDWLIDSIWDVYNDSLGGRNTSVLDDMIFKMMNTPLDKDYPLTGRNRMITDFIRVGEKAKVSAYLLKELKVGLEKADLKDLSKENLKQWKELKKPVNARIKNLKSSFDLDIKSGFVEAEDVAANRPNIDKASDSEKPDMDVLKEDYAIRESEALVKTLAKVDFNLFGKGSRQFNEMREALKELSDYANGRIQVGLANDGSAEGFDPFVYLEKKQVALAKVDRYLRYKEEQLNAEQGRANDPKRQKHEQPRIHTAYRILNKLQNSCAQSEIALFWRKDSKGVSAGERMEAYERGIRDQLEREDKIRNDLYYKNDDLVKEMQAYNNAKKIDKKAKVKTPKLAQYFNSVERSIACTEKLNANIFVKRSNEKYRDFLERIKKMEYREVKKPETQAGKDLVNELKQRYRQFVIGDKKEHYTNLDIKEKYMHRVGENYKDLKDLNAYSLSRRKAEYAEDVRKRGEKVFSVVTGEMISRKEIPDVTDDIHVDNSIDDRKKSIKQKIEAIAESALAHSGKPKDKVMKQIHEYIKKKYRDMVDLAGTDKAKPYDLTLAELESYADKGYLGTVFSDKVQKLADAEYDAISKEIKRSGNGWLKTWEAREEEHDKAYHVHLSRTDDQYMKFAKQEGSNCRQKWNAAQERMAIWKAMIEKTERFVKYVDDMINAGDTPLFEKNNERYEDRQKELLEKMALLGTRMLLQDALNKEDTSGLSLALRANEMRNIEKAIRTGIEKDEVMSSRPFLTELMENPEKLRDKCLEYVKDYSELTRKNKVRQLAEKKAAEKKTAEKNAAEKKKAESLRPREV